MIKTDFEGQTPKYDDKIKKRMNNKLLIL